MENKDSNEVNDIIKTIMSSLKSELDNIKSEIKEDLKAELDDIKSTLKDEIDATKTKEPPSPEPPFPPPPPHPFDDFHGPDIVTGNDDRESRKFDVSEFSKIHISGSFETEITKSDSYQVRVAANNSFFRNVDVKNEGDTLHISHSRHIGWRAALIRPRIEISLPDLKELKLSGAVSVKLEGFTSSESFKLDMSGASSLDGDINTGTIDLEMSGASRTRLTGSTRDAVVRASGAIRINLQEFTIENAAVKLGGASRMSAYVTGRLDARISGASYFGWRGEPVMGDIRTSGASRLSKEQ